MILALWRLLLGKEKPADRWLASGQYLSEQATQRIAREANERGRSVGD